MQKNIEIDLLDKSDLVEKYNEKKVSRGLIEYLTKQAILIGRKEDIKIVINKKCCIEHDCFKMIKEGLKEEYNKSLQHNHITDIKQIAFFILGILFIFLSTLIAKEGLLKELLLITGWVPIWKMLELELLSDMDERKRRRIIKKLLKSEMLERRIQS